jgi:glyoxylase-like metal-dependent hydrolase (beta-lactamase superfamily II)
LRDVFLVGGRHFFATNRAYADCNVYAIRTEAGVILVDTGYDEASIATIDRNLRYWGMDPADVNYVLLSHSHFDHAGNARAFQERGAKLFAHPTVREALRAGDERTIHYAFDRADFPTCEVDVAVDDGDTIELGGCRLEVISIPGHSDGSLVYRTRRDGREVLFVGDFTFHERMPTTEGSLAWNGGTEFHTDKFIDSLLRVQRIRADVVLPGHWGFLLENGATIIDKALVVALRAWGNRYSGRRV